MFGLIGSQTANELIRTKYPHLMVIWSLTPFRTHALIVSKLCVMPECTKCCSMLRDNFFKTKCLVNSPPNPSQLTTLPQQNAQLQSQQQEQPDYTNNPTELMSCSFKMIYKVRVLNPGFSPTEWNKIIIFNAKMRIFFFFFFFKQLWAASFLNNTPALGCLSRNQESRMFNHTPDIISMDEGQHLFSHLFVWWRLSVLKIPCSVILAVSKLVVRPVRTLRHVAAMF